MKLTSAGTTYTATSRSRQAQSVKSATAEPHTAIAACQAAEQTKPNKEPPAHESAPGPAADLSGTLLLDVRHEGSACDKPSYSAPQLPAIKTVTAAASKGGPSSQPSPEPHALLALATQIVADYDVNRDLTAIPMRTMLSPLALQGLRMLAY